MNSWAIELRYCGGRGTEKGLIEWGWLCCEARLSGLVRPVGAREGAREHSGECHFDNNNICRAVYFRALS